MKAIEEVQISEQDSEEVVFAGEEQLFLARDVEITGIQEKYLKCQLTEHEPLTELDVHRFLRHTGMAQHINVTRLDKRDIGLVLSCEAGKMSNNPSTIALMINAGSEGTPPYIRWISVVITIDPLSQKGSFYVNSGHALADEKKDEIIEIIEEAIRFEEQEKKAFPRLASISSEIKTHHVKQLCGYKVLHDLYNDDLLSGVVESESAMTFQSLSDMRAIEYAMYEEQLKAIHLMPHHESILTRQILMNFNQGKIIDERLAQQLDYLPAVSIGEASQHTLVLERISALKVYDTKARFPGENPTPRLTSNDYQQYLLLTHQKFKSLETELVLDEMIISCYDESALEGLSAYNGTGLSLPFHTLTLDFSELNMTSENDKARFMFKLKTLLISMSHHNLPALTFIDNSSHLSYSMVEDLSQFIKDRKIAIEITLTPAYKGTAVQKTIDDAVSDNIRHQHIARSSRSDLKESQESRHVGVIRKRPKLGNKQAISVDVELQEEQQVEVAVEANTDSSLDMEGMLETDDSVYTMEKFAYEFKSFDGTIKYSVRGSYDDGCDLWRQWTGALTNEEALHRKHGFRMSKSAIVEMLRYHNKFQYGLDLKNLPPGFVYKENKFSLYIHFDENYKRVSVYNPLQVQTRNLEEALPLSHALFERWLALEDPLSPIKLAWERLASRPYDKASTRLFKRLLPNMLLLEPRAQEQLFELCFDDVYRLNVEKLMFLMNESSDIRKQLDLSVPTPNLDVKLEKLFSRKKTQAYEFIARYHEKEIGFEHHLLRRLIGEDNNTFEKVKQIREACPQIHLNGLLQVYIEFDAHGLDKLMTLINTYPRVFAHLNAHVFSRMRRYSLILSDEYLDAIKAIDAFSAQEVVWWNVLIEQHGAAQKNVNLVDMVNAFKAFKNELCDLKLALPEHCDFRGVKSLPVALSRILSILKYCKEENRNAQWAEIPFLDLSEMGAIKLITKREQREWAFITAEMNIYASSIPASKTFYDAPSVLDIHAWTKGDDTKNFENFFRYVSYQDENGQLPLVFYKHTKDAITKAKLSEDVKRYFYPLIANATTGIDKVSTMPSLTLAIADIDHLIKSIIDTPIPGITPENIREMLRLGLLEFLDKLSSKPPLPLLNRLVAMILTSLNTISNVIKNVPRLDNAAIDFNDLLRQVGSSLYDGMKDYTADDYKNSELFFDYLALAKKISNDVSDTFSAKSLVSVLSTFRIKLDRVSEVIDAFNSGSDEVCSRYIEALTICQAISTKQNPDRPLLSVDDLNALLKQVGDSNNQVINIIKRFKLTNQQDLAAYFPKDFLENYGKEGIPEDVLVMIKANFSCHQHRRHIQKILLRFVSPTDKFHYIKIVEKITTITKYKNEVEKTLFIAKLAAADGLYMNAQPLDRSDNDFLGLLDALIVKKSTDEFMTLLTAERRFSLRVDEKGNPGLSKKAGIYLKTLSPEVRAIDNLVISPVDLVPRLQETLLSVPVSQLSVEPPESLFSLHLDHLLQQFEKEEPINFAPIVQATEEFIGQVPAAEQDACLTYLERVKPLTQSRVDSKTRASVMSNAQMKAFLNYLVDPTKVYALSLGNLFIVTSHLYKYPSLTNKKKLIRVLMNTPSCWNAMSQKKFLDNAKLLDYYSSDNVWSSIMQSLAADLDRLDDVRRQTLVLKRQIDAKKLTNRFCPGCVDLFRKVNSIAIDNPKSNRQFLELYDRYLSHYSAAKHGNLLDYLHNFVDTLSASFAKIDDKNSVLSLCLQFNSDHDQALQPEGLLELLRVVNCVHQDYQSTVLKIAVVLINNDKGYDLQRFSELCKVASEDLAFAHQLTLIYKRAPFPTMIQVLQWHEAAKLTDNYENAMRLSRQGYDINPCHRELKLNGFHVDKARAQLKDLQGFDPTLLDLERFKGITDEVRYKTTDELLDIFSGFKSKKFNADGSEIAVDFDLLVAVAAELLYRSKGKDEVEPTGGFAMGSSMEINTTQYLAILSSLKTPGHVTSQIGTGEGKSRIMMISIACQLAQGRTVDFVTSDAQLATRDFVEYQTYFELFGAKTSMIFGHTDPSLYQIGGVNFSDPSNLSLFRNKARSLGRGDEVIDPDETNRALLLDEADKTYFDVADTRFNFSQEGDESIRDMDWVYPLFMKYFSEERINVHPAIDGKTSMTPLDLYYENIDASRDNLMQFATKECSKQQLLRLKALSNAQIEQWQVSAVTASQLKFKEDFVIDADTLISTSRGPKISSDAQLLFANRVSKNSKFSFGVHQCLHARLNIARKNLEKETDAGLRQALSQCEYPFYIEDEKQIIYSSTSKNLLDDYKNGTLKAVTGTSGAIIERQEAQVLHGLGDGRMHFIDVPRHKGLNRTDHALRLTRDQTKQIEVLIEQIKRARAKNQPILVIAENDEESEILFSKLGEAFKDDGRIQHIHSQLSLKEEKKRIDSAGIAGQITVSTDMIGRGTDISLKGLAKEHGLHVMITYLPSTRDLEQIVGRSGRFGAKGETSMILDKHRLKATLGIKKLSETDFYADVDKFILIEQALMEKRSQCERLIKMTVGDFRKKLTDAFFDDMLRFVKKEEHKKLLPAWTSFFEKSDKAWNEQWPHLQQELMSSTIDVEKIQALLTEYRSDVQSMWRSMQRTIQDKDLLCVDDQKPTTKLMQDIPRLELMPNVITLLMKRIVVKYNKKVYDHYEPGHEGRLVDYSDWRIPWTAMMTGQRTPFAGVAAKLQGHGQLFPGLKRSTVKETVGVMHDAGHSEPVLSSTTSDVFSFSDAKPPLGYDEEKNKQAIDRLKLNGVVSDKQLISDLQWAMILNKLQQLIESYDFCSKSKSKLSRDEVKVSLVAVMNILGTVDAKRKRAVILKTSIDQLETINRSLKDGLVKKSTLKKSLNDVIIFYQTMLSQATMGVDAMELAEAVFDDEAERLKVCQQYPELHFLNVAWWHDNYLAVIERFPPEYYTRDGVDFLNRVGPLAFDDHVLKAIQIERPVLSASVDMDMLRARGTFLSYLETKGPPGMTLRGLAKPWWVNQNRYIDKLFTLPDEAINALGVSFLNTVNPEDIDDAFIAGVRYLHAKETLSSTPLTLDKLRYHGKQKMLLGDLSDTYPELHNLDQGWWSEAHVEKLKCLPNEYYTSDGVAYLNTLNPGALDEKVLKALTFNAADNIARNSDLERLSRQGEFLLCLSPFDATHLSMLDERWWGKGIVNKLFVLPKTLFTQEMITFLNTVMPEDITPVEINVLLQRRERGQGDGSLLTLDALKQEAMCGIREKIHATKNKYSSDVSKQWFSYFRAGYQKDKILKSALMTASSEEINDLNEVKALLELAKLTLTTTYGRYNWSWFGLVVNTSMSIKLLEGLIADIQALTTAPPSSSTM